MAALTRLLALLRKEFLLLLRDARMRFFVVVPPLVQLVVFGYAATFDVRHANVAWVDQGASAQARGLAAGVAASGHFRLIRFADMEEAKTALEHGRVRAIVHLDADLARKRRVQLIADGSDANSAQIIVARLAQAISQELDGAPGPAVEIRHFYNPNLEDRWFFIPGIMANVVLIATLVLTAMSIVRERELGTLERLMVTPLGRLEFLLGKLLPVACIGLFDVALITVLAVAWFEVPFRGSYLALFLGSALYLSSSLGIGLIISTYAGTQQQAMLTALFVIMPLVILSGFAFPIANMPEAVQWFTWLDPLRYFLVVVRDLFLKGVPWTALGFEFLMMGLLGLLALGLSALRLR